LLDEWRQSVDVRQKGERFEKDYYVIQEYKEYSENADLIVGY